MARQRGGAESGAGLFGVVLALALLGVAGDESLALRGANAAKHQKQQVIVFDAGSSGTRVHVFDMWLPRHPARAHVPVVDLSVRDAQTKKVKPGLSWFAQNDDAAGCMRNIEELLTFANHFVPEDKRASTPVLLKATAGLRAVRRDQSDRIIKAVRDTLHKSGYKFKPEWVDVIKGKEEGGLAWVAANYLQGNFADECFQNNVDYDSVSIAQSTEPDRMECQSRCANNADCKHFAYWPDATCYLHGEGSKLRYKSGVVAGPKLCESQPAESTLGVIEMGGGSTQVTFQVGEEDIVKPDDNFVFETARGKTYNVYAHSYLGYGQDHAQARTKDALLGVQADPCYPINYVRTVPKNEQAKAGKLIHGTGDALGCKGVVQKAIMGNADAPGQYSSELPLHGKFIATENFFYTQGDLRFGLEGAIIDPSRHLVHARRACNLSLDVTDAQMSDMVTGKSDPLVPKLCFGMSYQVALLESLQVPAAARGGDGIEVRITHKINGGDVDWALGAALVHYLEDLKSKGGWAPDVLQDSGAGALYPYLAILLVICSVPVLCRSPLGTKCREEILPQVPGLDGVKIPGVGVIAATQIGHSSGGVE